MARQPIGEFLATLRKAHGYTQQQVADELGISNRTLSAWEQGRAYPDILTLPALAELYGVTADEIINGERAKTGDSAGAIEELSEKAQTKLNKKRLSQYSNNCVIFTVIGSIGAALYALGSFCAFLWIIAFFESWFGIALEVLGVVSVILSWILANAFYRNALTVCGVCGDEPNGRQSAFAINAIKIKKRVFEISGWLWFASAVAVFVLFILNRGPWTYAAFPLLISIALLIYGHVATANTLKQYGGEAEIKVQKYNGKLFKLCAALSATSAVLALVFMIVFSNVSVTGTVYKGVDRADAVGYVHTLVIKEEAYGIAPGAYSLDIPEEIPTDGSYFNVYGDYIFARAVFRFSDNGYKVTDLNIYYGEKISATENKYEYHVLASAPQITVNGEENAMVFNVRYSDTDGTVQDSAFATTTYKISDGKKGCKVLKVHSYYGEFLLYGICGGAIAASIGAGFAVYFIKRKKI